MKRLTDNIASQQSFADALNGQRQFTAPFVDSLAIKAGVNSACSLNIAPATAR
jgi:hypothetical protein